MSTSLVVHNDAHALDRRDERADRPAVTMGMSFEQIVGMGDQLVRTGFLPDHIKNGAQAAAIILTGQELGMQPMRALRSLAMVKGKVVEYADSQLARFKADGGHAVFRRLDDTGAVLFLRHPNGDEHEESFTIEDARRAGLTNPSRNGEPSMFTKYPKPMLRSRAITAGLKSIGWEGGVGAYDPDEALTFGGSAAVAPAPAAGDPPHDIAWALAYPLPGKPDAWNGNGGKPLGEIAKSLVPSVRKWVTKKIESMEAAGDDAPPAYLELREACDLLLAARKAEAAQAADDALAPKAAQDGVDALARKLHALLKHEKLTDTERDDFMARATTGTATEDDLRRLVLEVEELIASPI